jgi:cytochrome c peroxidase
MKRCFALPSGVRVHVGILWAGLLIGCGTSEPEVIVISGKAAERGDTVAATHDAGEARPRGGDDSAASNDVSPRVLRRYAALDSPPERPAALVDLGRMLYYETRLSRTGDLACQSCHPLERYGATSAKFSTGVGGQTGSRNAPSTYHASGHFTQFWDGRAPTIEEQAKGPIVNPAEMGMKAPQVVATLQGIPGYQSAFARAFPGVAKPVTFDNVGVAIGAFEKGLVTPARWDRYLSGDTSALTPAEKEGAKLFANLGCIVCHTGPYLGGSMFEKVGARKPWPTQGDRGRRQVTGDKADDMMFKVPSLRNVAETAPYFHDASAATLEDAIRMMAVHQLEVELEDEEVSDIAAWMRSLTGELPRDYIARPELPR